jgi:cellulose synthase/poly-beta-1,6-N-acetylglucosamine synthase-like glycosyltransferase
VQEVAVSELQVARTTTVPVMSLRDQRLFMLFLFLFTAFVAAFLAWWFWPVHIVGAGQFAITTFLVVYAFAMPMYFFFFLPRMRRPNPALAVPAGLRVTFATTFVPGSEGLAILERTVRAMVGQTGHPHDVWVLDEGDSDEVKQLCGGLGVNHFSRKGIERYLARTWPFQARTKSGNYNAWLDWMRRRGIQYDVVLQMDTDHAPQPGYLTEMLRPFADPAVAYVAAPSITSGNWHESWVVRARYEVEATLHGALQMGYNDGWAPLIIGSHAAFRVGALEEIGGFGRTLAEDHHNTLQLNAAGLHGVFSPDAIAIGDGAPSFAEAMVQEYQWARALTEILLTFFPEERRRLPLRKWTQFLFAETWYPFFALTQALGFLTPAIALVTGLPWVSVNYFAFLGMYVGPTLICLLIVIWVRRQGWLRPRDAPVISWRSALLMLARWPFVLQGVLEAFAGRATRRTFRFRVTTKGGSGARRLPLAILAPYAVVVILSAAAIAVDVARGGSAAVNGYIYLALLNGGTYALVLVAVVALNARENLVVHDVPRRRVTSMHLPGFALGALTVLLIAAVGGLAVWRLGPPVALPAARPPPVALPTDRVFLGVYDPNSSAVDTKFDVEQVFVQWKPTIGPEVAQDLARILGRHRVPFVTVEPYPWNIDGLTAETLLTDVSSGRYDQPIQAIAAAVHAVAPSPVYLRFAHEMELADLYPWGARDPTSYIAMYRHFVETVRAAGAANARFVWSPAGNAGAVAYYPGDEFVDIVGATVLQDTIENFPHRMDQRYAELGHLGKPIVICEFGVSLPDQQAEIDALVEARQSFGNYPLLRGVIYFDAINPRAPFTDWRLTPQQMAVFAAPL